MTDIVERLHKGRQINAPYEPEHWLPAPTIQLQAAKEIERLRSEIARLRAALGKYSEQDILLGADPPAQPAEPLTDEKIDAIFAAHHDPMQNPWVNYRRFARAIETKLKEKNT